jgi:hypothetical protein
MPFHDEIIKSRPVDSGRFFHAGWRMFAKDMALHADAGARCLARTKAPEGWRTPRRWRELPWLS